MKYNHSLDHVAMSLAYARNGDVKRAVRAFTLAVKSPDVKDAVRILEASNAKAHAELMASRITASANKAVASSAKKKVVAEFDLGENADDVLGLTEDDVAEIEDGDTEAQPVEAGDDEDADDMGDEDLGGDNIPDDFDAQFASVLASMKTASTNKKK